METQKKIAKIENLFLEQKNILQNISLENYCDSINKIRSLELQKEIIKAIPNKKPYLNQ